MTQRKFTLVIEPSGHALLTCPDNLSTDEIERLRGAWQAWRSSDAGVAIMVLVEVRTVTEIILDVLDA